MDIMIIILIIILIIIVWYNRNLEKKYIKKEGYVDVKDDLISLPANDIHFINDANTDELEINIMNYRIKDKYMSVFKHKNVDNYNSLGQYCIVTEDKINNKIMEEKMINKRVLNILTSSNIYPIDFNLIWTSDVNKDGDIFSVWSPVPPKGFTTLGDIIVLGIDKPKLNIISCLPITMLEKISISNGLIWNDINDMGKKCYCWNASNIDTFKSSNSYNENMNELYNVYNLPLHLLQTNTLINNNTITI